MPADVVKTELLPAQGRELITIMDDFGTEFHLYVPVSASDDRQARIDAAITQQSANQARLESYAVTHKIDLAAQRTAGQAKKIQAAKKG